MGLAKTAQKSRGEELELLSSGNEYNACLMSAKAEGEEKLFFALWEGIRSS